ncbi:MAG TPA: ArsC family transcriptional regulator [Spirochaetia bacterium]|nr:ArsC family transcriptional regulator [Spirochaetia bacterium]
MSSEVSIQVIGSRKNAPTRKAIRFFSERGVKAHVVDLSERALKRGELENITRGMDPIDLIDTESPAYQKGGFSYLEFDPIEEMLEHPLLMKMPVVRMGRDVTVGEALSVWSSWLTR